MSHTPMLIRAAVVACAVMLLLASCGPAVPTQTIGPEGGTVVAADGASVTVPPGALTSRVPVAITLGGAGAPPLPAGTASAGTTYALTPHGTVFLEPVTVSLPLAATTTGGVQVLKTNALGDWFAVPSTSSSGEQGERLEAEVSTFSWITTTTDTRDVNAAGMHRSYWFFGVPRDGNDVTLVKGPPTEQVDGELHEFHSYGPLPAEFYDGQADADVYSSADGATYWVNAEGPGEDPPDLFAGNEVLYAQEQAFEKLAGDATLRFVITSVRLRGLYYGGIDILPFECVGSDVCALSLFSQVTFDAEVWVFRPGGARPYSTRTFARLSLPVPQVNSSQPVWSVSTGAASPDRAWTLEDFEFQHVGREAWMELAEPITVEVDLSDVAVGEKVMLSFHVEVETMNQVQGETYVAGFLRDPLEIDGVGVEYAGLQPLPELLPPTAEEEAPACTSGIDPAAGTIQFATDGHDLLELPLGGEHVIVTREGGSSGDVSVRVRTLAGSAHEGDDFYPIDTVVFFADGDDSPRALEVPLVVDDVAEPLETFGLVLSDPRGCAGLGAPAVNTISVYDNDTPTDPDEGHFGVGGTVRGLVGSGLVLTGFGSVDVTVDEDGPFTFPQRRPPGVPYDVKVRTQPTAPAQVCSVSNGAGTLGEEDVTDVSVTCLPPQGANAYLDPSFGSGGLATAPRGIGEGVTGVAVQPDGRLLVLSAHALTRFTADGALDAGFGSGGRAEVDFLGTPYDEAFALAVQPDGKIVVVGQTRAGPALDDSIDWVVARYTGAGSLDTAFGPGGNGVVIGDSGSTPGSPFHESLVDVVIQPDGAIVAGGTANRFNVGSDFFLVRLTDTGVLDQSFGLGGVAAGIDIAGATDIARAIVLQDDGRIVIVGRVAPSGGAEPDIGALRYLPDGSLDTGFGDQGVMRDETDGWDEPWDAVGLAGGGLLVAGHGDGTGGAVATLARYTAAGEPDISFGSGGRAMLLGLQLARSVVQVEAGRLAVVGIPTGAPDFVVQRYDEDGAVDTTVGDGGVLRVDLFGGADEATALTVQSDGKLVIAGTVKNGTTDLIGLARSLP